MWRAPGPFDVVWCRFPYQGGARHHPCLVLLVGEDGMQPGGVWLVVAGGTSANQQGQWRRKIKPSDFVLQGDAATRAGLVNPTAFQLDAGVVLKLPWTTDFFDPAPGKRTPVMGAVDFSSERMRTLFKNAATRKFMQHLNSLNGA